MNSLIWQRTANDNSAYVGCVKDLIGQNQLEIGHLKTVDQCITNNSWRYFTLFIRHNLYNCLSVLSCLSCFFSECITNADCNHDENSAKCVKGQCKCKDELIKDGKKCKAGKNRDGISIAAIFYSI